MEVLDNYEYFRTESGLVWVKKGNDHLCVPHNESYPDGYCVIIGLVIVSFQEDDSSQNGEITWCDNDKIRVRLDDGNEIEFSQNDHVSIDGRFRFDFFWPDFEDNSDDEDDSEDNSEDNSDDEDQV